MTNYKRELIFIASHKSFPHAIMKYNYCRTELFSSAEGMISTSVYVNSFPEYNDESFPFFSPLLTVSRVCCHTSSICQAFTIFLTKTLKRQQNTLGL